MPINKVSVSPSNHQVTVSTSYANEILINYMFMINVFFPKPKKIIEEKF